MRGQEDGSPIGRRLADGLMDLLLDERIEARRRFIEDEELGFTHQCLHDSDLLSVALGQRPDRAVQLEIESLHERSDGRPGGPAPEMTEVSEQLTRGETLVEGQVTREVADPSPDGDAVVSDVEPKQADPACVWTDQIEEEANGRRLSRTVGSQEPEDLAARDDERHVFDAPATSVAFGHAVESDRRNSRCALGFWSPSARQHRRGECHVPIAPHRRSGEQGRWPLPTMFASPGGIANPEIQLISEHRSTGGAEEPSYTPRPDAERKFPQDHLAAVALGDVVDLERKACMHLMIVAAEIPPYPHGSNVRLILQRW